jgi:hypothetical protein
MGTAFSGIEIEHCAWPWQTHRRKNKNTRHVYFAPLDPISEADESEHPPKSEIRNPKVI